MVSTTINMVHKAIPTIPGLASCLAHSEKLKQLKIIIISLNNRLSTVVHWSKHCGN